MDEAKKTPEEIQQFYLERVESSIRTLLHKFHMALFHEEYDELYDSNVEAHERALGKNPMRAEHIEAAAQKRKKLGVSPLGIDGRPMDYSSDRYVHQLIFDHIEKIKKQTENPETKIKSNLREYFKKNQ